MEKRICNYCNGKFERDEMMFTKDCHGIVLRLVCKKCYHKLMAKGYDGAYYTEADEQIEADY